MSDDPLVRAARALRESRDGASPDASITRARVLAGAALRRKRRRSAAIVLLPLAAAFVMSTAWAAVTGRIPALAALWGVARPTATHPTVGGSRSPSGDETEDVIVPIVSAPAVASAPPGTPPSAAVPSVPSAPGIEAPTTRESIEAPTTRETVAAPMAPARRASPSNEASSSSRHGAPDGAADVEESLYADAHRAHFVARDPASALRGWDAYLGTYPNGRFALEARYNRALTLVRLGRMVEARAALVPFADGSNDGYRQQEARALLDALDGGP